MSVEKQTSEKVLAVGKYHWISCVPFGLLTLCVYGLFPNTPIHSTLENVPENLFYSILCLVLLSTQVYKLFLHKVIITNQRIVLTSRKRIFRQFKLAPDSILHVEYPSKLSKIFQYTSLVSRSAFNSSLSRSFKFLTFQQVPEQINRKLYKEFLA